MKAMLLLAISFAAATIVTTDCQAKIWRVNNNTGTAPDFTTLVSATASASVVNGDSIYVEPSSTAYALATVSKQLVIIGNGYLLTGTGSNSGLQFNTFTSKAGIRYAPGCSGTKIIGMDLTGSGGLVAFFGTGGFSSPNASMNVTIEKCQVATLGLASSINYTGATFRKCFFTQTLGETALSLNDFTIENCIFHGSNGVTLTSTTASNLTIRNNVFRLNNGVNVEISNAYIANNIFITSVSNTFTDCNVKNNLFSFNQTSLPVGATANLISQIEADIFTLTGSNDGKYQLKVGSPAIGAGVTISGSTPDCGAYGGNDPYKLSGIPAIPSIYGFTVPTSIPLGQSTMSASFSSRNNN